MLRRFACALAGLALLVAGVLAQEGIQRGKIKKVDAEKGVVTVTLEGKDLDLTVVDQTQVKDAANNDIKDRLKDNRFKEGAQVQFKGATKDGKTVLAGLRLAGAGAGGGAQKQKPNQEPPPKVDTSKFKPLPELGKEQYQGYQGGFYPGGSNERPAAHEAAGLALAKSIQPLDANGKPSPDGKIVLLSVGMSNTTMQFSVFKQIADADKDKNPKLVIVDGAINGQTAAKTQNPDDNGSGTKYWATSDERLKKAGVTPAQVQAVWIKQADAYPDQPFPKHAQVLQAELLKIMQVLHKRFPNVKLCYLSSRTYGGYATSKLNPEPYAYEEGFAVKWLIEQQLKGEPELNYDASKGPVKSPWLSWGPYVWANGSTKNADGFNYEIADVIEKDRTHPSQSGREKVAKHLLEFLKKDSTAKIWFVKQ